MNIQNEILSSVCQTDFFIYSFWKSFDRKLTVTGYVQVDAFFRHYSETERVNLLRELHDVEIEHLMKKSIVDAATFLDTLNGLAKAGVKKDLLFGASEECCKAIVSWLLFCNKQRHHKMIRNALAEKALQRQNDYEFVEEKYIIRRNIKTYFVDNVSDYLEVILSTKPKGKMFYRGQCSLNYWIEPSICRKKAHHQNEAVLYQELTLRCPSEFEMCKSHLDYLVEMQHYGLPTRLVDISTNPLVALFFAANSKDSKSADGEVILFDIPKESQKYERSDTVSILSCLPLFSFDEQQHLLRISRSKVKEEFNEDRVVLRLVHEIRRDRPAFTNEILPTDVQKCLVVTPSMKNNRIVKQSGAFIICGLAENYQESNPLEQFRYSASDGQQVLLIIKNRKRILKELRLLDVHRATLFPEIDDVADYLKNDWTP